MSSVSRAGEPAVARASRPKRPELQALRALAVGVVILNHSWPSIAPGGYVGVDVFFVISGFLITQQLVSEARETSALKLGRFYAKRARRILPAATLVLLVCAMMTFVAVPSGQWGKFFTEITASALYVHNWVMVPELAGTSNSPVMHYWSLSVEEQFYLVWPLAILAAIAIARWRKLHLGIVIPLMLAVIVVVSFAYSVLETSADLRMAYFSTFSRAWEFGIGGLVALIPASFVLGARTRAVTFWAGLALIVASAIAITDGSTFPGPLALIPVLGTVAVIVASGAGLPKSTAWIVNARPVQTMGDISYSLYLWHWPVLLFAPYITGVPSESWFMVILLSFALALAWLTTKLVENPIRRTPLASPEFHERRVGLTRVGVVSLLLTVGLSGIGASVQATRTDNLAGECRGVMAPGATNVTSVGQADCERSTPLDRELR